MNRRRLSRRSSLLTGLEDPHQAWARGFLEHPLAVGAAPNFGRVSGPAESCQCGMVVISSDELEELGLCVVCAGSGHEWACACTECWGYFEGSDRGIEPSEALAESLRSAATTAGSGSR